MAGNIKGITIEFRGDTTSLDKALRKITNETKSIDRELKQVDKALKFNPTSVELWKQKQELLKQKISETGEKLKLLKDEQARMDAAGVDKNSEEYRKLQREIIVTESQVKTFEAQLRKVGNVNLRAASESVKELGNKLTAAGQAMREFSMAGAAVVGVLGAMTYKSSELADDINTLSKKYNISTDDLQMYKLAAEQVDVSVESIAKTHVKLTKSMASAAKGTGSQAEAFEKLGISVVDQNGNLRDADEVWQETIQKLGQMTNETERDALAQQLLGKAAADLNPLIEDGGEAYKRVADIFSKYNLELIDEETLDKANQFNDELMDIKSMGTLAFSMVGAELAGYLLPVMEKVVDVVGKIVGWLAQLDPKILAIVGAIAGVVAVLGPALLIAGKIAFAISSIMSLMSTLGVSLSLLAGPVGIVIAVIAALIAIGILLYKNWDTIKAKATELWTHITTVFNNIKTTVINVWNGIKTFLTNVWAGIKTVAQTIWEGIKMAALGPVYLMANVIKNNWSTIKSATTSAWNAIKTAITTPFNSALETVQSIIKKIKGFFPISLGKVFTNLKLPHFSVSGGSAPWGIGGKGSLPKWSVSWYAKGGIFKNPTIFASGIGVGEAGAEAVVPLGRFWEEIRNSNARTDQILAQQTQILLAMYEELQKEKNFKVDNVWAGRYVNSLVKQ